jgi:hypothetical protein
MPIRHNFVSPLGDASDPDIVGPDEWNEDHIGTAPATLYVPLWLSAAGSTTTYNVNSTTYVFSVLRAFWIDFDTVTWNSYRLVAHGASSTSGQSVSLAIIEDVAGPPVLSGDTEDLIINTTSAAWWDSGWKTIPTPPSGFVRLGWGHKGSNATVDISQLSHLSVTFRSE